MREIKPKKSWIVNQKPLIVTVDIGKTMNVGYWRTPEGIEAKPFKFFNNGQGFNKFWANISMAKKTYNIEKVIVGSESTGSYGEPLLHFLRKRKVELVQVNPMHSKRIKELQGNSPNKTDKKDPKVIADIIELGRSLTVVIPTGAAAELRRLSQARERNVRRRTALFNTLQQLEGLIFPEFCQVMKDVKTKSSRYLLKEFPIPQAIKKVGVFKLAAELKKVSWGKLGTERARQLYQAARSSVGISEGQQSVLFEIKQNLILIEQIEDFISDLERRICDYLNQVPSSKFILSIRGIGEITAAGIIGEVGDFSKFKHYRELEKLAGLDLFEISSGKHKGISRISKRGRSYLRKLLYFSSLIAVRKKGEFHQWYQSALARGMPKMKALVAVARKLLRIIFAVVRDHSEYVSNYSKTEALEAVA